MFFAKLLHLWNGIAQGNFSNLFCRFLGIDSNFFVKMYRNTLFNKK